VGVSAAHPSNHREQQQRRGDVPSHTGAGQQGGWSDCIRFSSSNVTSGERQHAGRKGSLTSRALWSVVGGLLQPAGHQSFAALHHRSRTMDVYIWKGAARRLADGALAVRAAP
jgi:hypothetical protein